MPAWPTSDTRRARRSRPTAWNCSFRKRSSSVRPTNGGSRASGRRAPPRSPTTRTASHDATGADLPLSSCSPAATNSIAASAASFVASPTSTPPGGATDWSRAAVLTMSPVTMPWPSAPTLTAASPVRTPTRTCEIHAGLPAERRDHVDEIEGGPDGALGVVLVGDRGAPHRHDRIADELLDDAAVAIDDHPRPLEVLVLELAHRLRVTVGRERREADEVGEEDRHHTSFRGAARERRRRSCRLSGAVTPDARGSCRSLPQNRAPAGLCAPQFGQPPRAAPQSRQKRPSSGVGGAAVRARHSR